MEQAIPLKKKGTRHRKTKTALDLPSSLPNMRKLNSEKPDYQPKVLTLAPKFTKQHTLMKNASAEASIKHRRTKGSMKRPTALNTVSEAYGNISKQASILSKARTNEMSMLEVDDEKDESDNSDRMNKHDQNWYELRLPGRFPDRRAYHSSFLIDDK